MIRASMITIIIISALTIDAHLHQKKYCQRGESCWPKYNDIKMLEEALHGTDRQSRILKWNGDGTPRVCSVPINSVGDQPLYGFGVTGLNGLYSDPSFNKTDTCFSGPGEKRDMCLTATRNNPLEGWSPGFVVWARNVKDVQAAVRFAVSFNLCIMVVAQGHDFLNRHSCSDGVMIRTTLLKNIEWDLDDKKGFGNADGNVKLGAGITGSELHKTASDNNRFGVTGWGITVGLVGFSLGGGHGPFGNAGGLGLDNILEVDIITANGDLVTANSKNNTDIFWAIRGGGGSTWGVVTALTVKAHKIPSGGLLFTVDHWGGDFCDDGKKKLHTLIDEHQQWALTLDYKWSGITFITPTKGNSSQCGGNWDFQRVYTFQGSKEEANRSWFNMTTFKPYSEWQHPVANWWQEAVHYELEYIIPVQYLNPPGVVGSIVSVLVSRDMVANGSVAAHLKARVNDCVTGGPCERQGLYQAITGNIGSQQDPNVAIPHGFRTALFHYESVNWNQTITDTYYALGEHSYFSESAYTQIGDSWKYRYWGNNYEKLLKIKQKWDPNNVFWCYHCVGSDI